MNRCVASCLALGVLLIPGLARAEWPAHVTVVKSEKGKTVTVKGKLENGKLIEDLSWASSSSNACFPATQNEKFRGPHVIFATEIPPRSEMKITVKPDDPKVDLSIWAYEVGTTNFALPPNLPSCVTCEAEHKWDRPKRGKTQDSSRTVEVNAIQDPFSVVIGVSGPAASKAGGFTLTIETK